LQKDLVNTCASLVAMTVVTAAATSANAGIILTSTQTTTTLAAQPNFT
jgi:hypothetical protein